MNCKPVFLAFAAINDAKAGTTGAAIGTETVIDSLREHFEIEIVPLKTNGLGQLGARSPVARVKNIVRAASRSIGSFLQLAVRGITGKPVEIFYFLPASSRFGIVRNAVTIMIKIVFFPQARMIFHIRNGNYFEQKSSTLDFLSRHVNRHADQILVLSALLLPKELSYWGLKIGQISVIPNTIDSELVPNGASSSRAVLPPIRVLYLSNFITEKGYWTLLEAGEILVERDDHPNLEFTFYGKWLNDTDRETFEKRARALTEAGLKVDVGGNLSDRVSVQELYSRHHIFCLPTVYPAEAQPRSILEAMANGCAVIATKHRSIPDQVENGITGILINDQNASELADALNEVASADPIAMGRAGAERFERFFSPGSVHDNLLKAMGVTVEGKRLE